VVRRLIGHVTGTPFGLRGIVRTSLGYEPYDVRLPRLARSLMVPLTSANRWHGSTSRLDVSSPVSTRSAASRALIRVQIPTADLRLSSSRRVPDRSHLSPVDAFLSVVSCRMSGESAWVRMLRSGSIGCPVSTARFGAHSPVCERFVRGGPARDTAARQSHTADRSVSGPGICLHRAVLARLVIPSQSARPAGSGPSLTVHSGASRRTNDLERPSLLGLSWADGNGMNRLAAYGRLRWRASADAPVRWA